MPAKKSDNSDDSEYNRVSLMKKAGLSPRMILVLTLVSSPGFYTYFFDKSSELAAAKAANANKKAEIAYEVLVAEVTGLRRDNELQDTRLQNVTNLLMLMMQKDIRSGGVLPVASIPVRRGPRGGGAPSEASESGAILSDLFPSDMIEDMEAQQKDPVSERRKALPSNLEGLMAK